MPSEHKRTRDKTPEPSYFGKFKFYIVDFKDGPQIVPGSWLSADLGVCSWPPWAEEPDMDQRAYDKKMRETPEPDSDWTDCTVERVRAYGDNIEYVRRKLKPAEDVSDTDLNTDAEGLKGRTRRKSHLQLSISQEPESTDSLESSTRTTLPNVCLIEKSAARVSVHERVQDVKSIQSVRTKESTRKPIVQLSKSSRVQAIPVCSTSTTNLTEMAYEGVGIGSLESKSRGSESLPLNCSSSANSSVERTAPKTVAGVSSNSKVKNAGQAHMDRAGVAATNMTEIEFKAYLIRGITSIYQRLTSLEGKCQAYSSGRNNRGSAPVPVEDEFMTLSELPALSRQQFEEWAQRLSEKPYEDEVVPALTRAGGDDVGSCVRALLCRVMSNACAENFSFCGSNGKKGKFEDTKFLKVAYRAVRRTDVKFESASDKEIEKHVKSWLRQASHREGGSKQAKKKIVPSTPRPTPKRTKRTPKRTPKRSPTHKTPLSLKRTAKSTTEGNKKRFKRIIEFDNHNEEVVDDVHWSRDEASASESERELVADDENSDLEETAKNV